MSIMLRRSQVFTVFHRRLELRSQLLAAPAVVIGEQHQLLPVRLQTADAFQQALSILRSSPGAPADPGCLQPLPLPPAPPRSRVRPRFAQRCRWHGFGQSTAIHVIGDDRAGIELSGAVPDLDVSLLDDLLSKILSPQDTQHDGQKSFRPASPRTGAQRQPRLLLRRRQISQTSSAGVSIQCPQNRDSRHRFFVRTKSGSPEGAVSYLAPKTPRHQPSIPGLWTASLTKKTRTSRPGLSMMSKGEVREAPQAMAPDACAHQADAVEVRLAHGRFPRRARRRLIRARPAASTFLSSSKASVSRLLASSS